MAASGFNESYSSGFPPDGVLVIRAKRRFPSGITNDFAAPNMVQGMGRTGGFGGVEAPGVLSRFSSAELDACEKRVHGNYLIFVLLRRYSHDGNKSSQICRGWPVEETDNREGFERRGPGLPRDTFFGDRFSKTCTGVKWRVVRQIRRLSTFPATMIMSMSICTV
jgi:hypothetical protein